MRLRSGRLPRLAPPSSQGVGFSLLPGHQGIISFVPSLPYISLRDKGADNYGLRHLKPQPKQNFLQVGFLGHFDTSVRSSTLAFPKAVPRRASLVFCSSVKHTLWSLLVLYTLSLLVQNKGLLDRKTLHALHP